MVWAPDSPDLWAPDSATPQRWAPGDLRPGGTLKVLGKGANVSGASGRVSVTVTHSDRGGGLTIDMARSTPVGRASTDVLFGCERPSSRALAPLLVTTRRPFQKYGAVGNMWGAVKAYLNAVGEATAAPVIEKYTGVLAGADVFTPEVAFWLMESMRLNRGDRPAGASMSAVEAPARRRSSAMLLGPSPHCAELGVDPDRLSMSPRWGRARPNLERPLQQAPAPAAVRVRPAA